MSRFIKVKGGQKPGEHEQSAKLPGQRRLPVPQIKRMGDQARGAHEPRGHAQPGLPQGRDPGVPESHQPQRNQITGGETKKGNPFHEFFINGDCAGGNQLDFRKATPGWGAILAASRKKRPNRAAIGPVKPLRGRESAYFGYREVSRFIFAKRATRTSRNGPKRQVLLRCAATDYTWRSGRCGRPSRS
jgi:hypothetical protein